MYIAYMQTQNAFLKGSISTLILKLLKENGRMYGYEITRTVDELSAGAFKITEGALYPALHKLESEGFVEYTVEIVDNRKRKYYSLTKSGKKVARNKMAEFLSFFNLMERVLQLNPVVK